VKEIVVLQVVAIIEVIKQIGDGIVFYLFPHFDLSKAIERKCFGLAADIAFRSYFYPFIKRDSMPLTVKALPSMKTLNFVKAQ
jgi:hypothetical protein